MPRARENVFRMAAAIRLGRLALAGLLAAGLGLAPARGQAAVDLKEQLVNVPVTVKSMYDGSQTHDMFITVFRPQGPGPFPLAVISHGRAVSREERAEPQHQRMESAARFLVRKGFVVLVPTRIGYGATGQSFDPEDSGPAKHPDYQVTLDAAVTQILAAVDYGRHLDGVDANRIVLVGQSVGGFSTVGAAAKNPPGLVAAINFAGGDGGDPVKHPGVPNGSGQLLDLYRALGRQCKVPMLWVYTENDRYFAPDYSKAWAKAYADAGATVDYRLLPAFEDNGHRLFEHGCDLWMPLVDEFLQKSGFAAPGLIPRPRPTGFAALDQVDKVPQAKARNGYRKFLEAPLPRAFALSSDGHWGFAHGDDALSRALAFCRGNGGAEDARLYAVDNDVVW
jgi:dienelactone hydrolase